MVGVPGGGLQGGKWEGWGCWGGEARALGAPWEEVPGDSSTASSEGAEEGLPPVLWGVPDEALRSTPAVMARGGPPSGEGGACCACACWAEKLEEAATEAAAVSPEWGGLCPELARLLPLALCAWSVFRAGSVI